MVVTRAAVVVVTSSVSSGPLGTTTSPSSGTTVVDVGASVVVAIVDVVVSVRPSVPVAVSSGEPGSSTTWPATLRTAASATVVATSVARTQTRITPIRRITTPW